jgi:hypothetical protein
MVAYPVARRVSAIVGASSGMSPKYPGKPGLFWASHPVATECAFLPVNKAARADEQIGCVV